MEIVAVTDRRICTVPFLEQIEAVAASGIDMLVLREKDLNEDDYERLALSVRDICSRYGVRFCVNTFADVAVRIGADLLWLPFPVFMEGGSPMATGVSVHSQEEAVQAWRRGASFLIYGNVFETSCKPGKPACGADALHLIAESVPIPIYGIGGIYAGNVRDLRNTGAAGICMMSGMMQSPDPNGLVESLRNNLS